MTKNVLITGIGMVTPLGNDPAQVLGRLEAGESAAGPVDFDATSFACRKCARVRHFRAQEYVAESKMVRLMNRDAQLAVGAARLALRDSRLTVKEDYASEEIALFGATGLAGLPLSEVAPLIRNSVGRDGGFDLGRFGREGLRSISPLLSFKVLGNMPVCFVSICENIQGVNGVYTPWEGQGAQAIAAGVQALEQGEARCALVGGCDVKTHELAFLALEQLGLLLPWAKGQSGPLPGEGAVFLVLELEEGARQRGVKGYARIAGWSTGTLLAGSNRSETYRNVLDRLVPPLGADGKRGVAAIIGGADGDEGSREDEVQALHALQLGDAALLYPKAQAGNLFAAAAALQVALGALLVQKRGRSVLANCFGYGSEQAAFWLEQS